MCVLSYSPGNSDCDFVELTEKEGGDFRGNKMAIASNS